MHTPAPPLHQTFPAACLSPIPVASHRRRGFSLIEVTLAIAIVAFAFIALIGLLPAGLSVFNQTVDSTNEMRISQNLVSMLQSTDFDNLKGDSAFASNIYYYDVDGGFLDSEQDPKPNFIPHRIYAARALFDQQNIPQPGQAVYDPDRIAIRALILVGKNNEAVKTYMSSLSNSESVHKKLDKHSVRVFPIVITKTDGLK